MKRDEVIELLTEFAVYLNKQMDVYDPIISIDIEISGFLKTKWAKENITTKIIDEIEWRI